MPIIQVENLSKAYRLGAIGGRTLEADFSRWWARIRGKPDPYLKIGEEKESRTYGECFWALRNVGFQVREGESLGIIGRNGAGKSTLLKILSQVTGPTHGEVRIKGRIASLLEVGTGFHPDLTGRENVFMNGAILGMTKAEIRQKFDEIVAFASVEKFIDTPVKRYSSGMHVRLAFAVAAHLEPEVLIVDEVLAVGDASFQKKCLSKMEQVGQHGRTVLFVSHNMQAITRLCPRVIVLDAGEVIDDAPAHHAVKTYLRSDTGVTSERAWPAPPYAPGNEVVRLRAVRARTEAGAVTEAFDIRCPIGVEMEFEVHQAGHVLVPVFHFFDEQGVLIFAVIDHDPAWRRKPRPPGHYVATAWLPGNTLAEGVLVVSAAISTVDPHIIHVHERDVVAFHVIDSLEGDSARGDYAGPFPGVVRPLVRWTTNYSASALS